VPLGSRVTLGSRVSLLLCITQFVLHAREGAPRGRVSLKVRVGRLVKKDRRKVNEN